MAEIPYPDQNPEQQLVQAGAVSFAESTQRIIAEGGGAAQVADHMRELLADISGEKAGERFVAYAVLSTEQIQGTTSEAVHEGKTSLEKVAHQNSSAGQAMAARAQGIARSSIEGVAHVYGQAVSLPLRSGSPRGAVAGVGEVMSVVQKLRPEVDMVAAEAAEWADGNQEAAQPYVKKYGQLSKQKGDFHEGCTQMLLGDQAPQQDVSTQIHDKVYEKVAQATVATAANPDSDVAHEVSEFLDQGVTEPAELREMHRVLVQVHNVPEHLKSTTRSHIEIHLSGLSALLSRERELIERVGHSDRQSAVEFSQRIMGLKTAVTSYVDTSANISGQAHNVLKKLEANQS